MLRGDIMSANGVGMERVGGSHMAGTIETQESQLSIQVLGDDDLMLGVSDLHDDEGEEEFIPPENLAMVCKGIYRSALPKKKNFPYLTRMGLKSILTLFQVRIYDGCDQFSQLFFS